MYDHEEERFVLRIMLRSKIHRATVTDANLEYEGSITLDESLMEAAGIRPYEQVAISNLHNGERLETYVIPARRDSGIVCLNGPAARKGAMGDKIIIFCYAMFTEDEIGSHQPKIIKVDEKNQIVGKH
jgi:aspartate 1-decarboxylase